MTAILVALKKQQVFADWQISKVQEDSVLLEYKFIKKGGISSEDCDRLLMRQLDDEQVREKLEKDFKPVRDLLVKTALSPIVNA